MFFVSKTKYNELEGENFSLKMQIQAREIESQLLKTQILQLEKMLHMVEIECKSFEKIIKENIRKD